MKNFSTDGFSGSISLRLEFRQYIQPPGVTIPAYLPQIRLMPWPNILAQQHEGLHFDFNAHTNIGNAITLLNLLSSAVSTHEVGQTASLVAASWYEAIAESLEGVICYIAYHRAARRDKNLLTVEQYKKLLPDYMRPWKVFRSIYDSLPLSDYSKDGLAMIVATMVFNLPVYQLILDLRRLRNIQKEVTRTIIKNRFKAYHEAITSQSGREFCCQYDKRCNEIYNSSVSMLEKSSRDFQIVYGYLCARCPQILSTSEEYTPSSAYVVKAWEQQFKELGIVPSSEIYIKRISGTTRGANLVTVNPPSPRIRNLYPLRGIDEAFLPLGRKSNLWCIGFLYEHHGGPYVLSYKYNRTLHDGECYARFHYVDSNTQNNTVRQKANAGFIITSRDELLESLSSCNQHPRMILISTVKNEELLDKCAFSEIGCKFLCWRVEWNLPPAKAVQYIQNNLGRLGEVFLFKDPDPSILFIFAITRDTKQRIVIPLVSSAIEEAGEMFSEYFPKPPDLTAITQEELRVGITMLKSCAF